MNGQSKVTVDGVEIDAAALLAALHNNTRAIGMGVLHDLGRPMTQAEAESILADKKRFNFDYICGRPIKVFAEDDGSIGEHARRLYDRDAGSGAFDRALSEALSTRTVREAESA